MTKRESLTESMRRYSNIVNEAEQLNENLFRIIDKLLRRMRQTKNADNIGKSSLRQHENIQDLVNSFTRELGDDPDQWAGKMEAYFAKIHEKTKQQVFDRSTKYTHGDPARKYDPETQTRGANMRADAVIRQFEPEWNQLVEATRKYAQDPYSIEPQKHLSKIARDILEKIKEERPAAPSLPANHLEAVYEAIMLTKEENFFPYDALKVFGVIMAQITLLITGMVTLQVDHDRKREREREAGRERYLRNQGISQGRRDQDFYGPDDDDDPYRY